MQAPTVVPPPETWPEHEFSAARARCTALLKGLDAVVVQEPPLKQGGCGTPAPVQLVSIGKNPQVAFSPPPTVTCDMVAALGGWIRDEVQPSARKLLGSPIARIDVMSSYSCRGAYGRAFNRLSEHAHANAIDVKGFLTTGAAEVTVLADWGPTAREISAQVAAARIAAEKLAAEKAAAERAKATQMARQPGVASPPVAAAPPAPAAQPPAAVAERNPLPSVGTIIEGVPGLRLPGPRTGESSTGFGLSPPSRLGGPKPKETASAPPQPAADQAQRRSEFLRSIHASACRTFGTILGPEANNAHRNHFHLDMAMRKSGNFCE